MIAEERLTKALDELPGILVEYPRLDVMFEIEQGDMWDHLTTRQKQRVVEFVQEKTNALRSQTNPRRE